MTGFGVTDILFLAIYYKKAEVLIDDVKRCTGEQLVLKKMRKISCEVIIKCVGIQADEGTDTALGLSEVVGLWADGDAYRPVCTNGVGVNAQRFSTFSFGVSISKLITIAVHMLLYPSDLDGILELLPVNKADDSPTKTAYAPSMQHYLQTIVHVGSMPALALKLGHADIMKSTKHHFAHPLESYLKECEAEWETYIKLLDPEEDKKPPKYPYTKQFCSAMVEEINSRQEATPGKAH